MEKPRKAILLKLDGRDKRNPVIRQWMNKTGAGSISESIRDVLYRYIVGLLIPAEPQFTFHIHLEGRRDSEVYQSSYKFRAANEQEAQQQALQFAQDNAPDYHWHIQNGLDRVYVVKERE